MNKSRFAPVTLGVSLLLTACLIAGVVMNAPQLTRAVAQDRNVVSPEKLETATDLSTAFRQVAESVQPSVVSISTRTKPKQVRGRRGGNPNLPPEFRQFFPDLFEEGGEFNYQTPPSNGLGSGVIVREDGYILTNNHVVAEADELQVTLQDGTKKAGKVVGTDPRTDLAVVKIEASGLVAAPIGDSEALRVGDWVVAIGSPFGLEQTVTAGIISAKHRTRGILSRDRGYEDFLQTDAAINPGNSGGPLLNLRGEVIGINTAIESRGGGFNGIGFAVPSSIIKPVMESIIKDGKVRRGMLGAQVAEVDAKVAEELGVKENVGVLVHGVLSGRAADKAGLQAGDIVLEANGKPMNDSAQFRFFVASNPPGATLKLKVLRGNDAKDVVVTLDELTEDAEASFEKAMENAKLNVPTLGIRVEPLTEELADRLGVDPDLRGVVVMEVKPDGKGAEAELEPGDLITVAAGNAVNSAKELNDVIEKNRQNDKRTRLQILRGDMRGFAVVE